VTSPTPGRRHHGWWVLAASVAIIMIGSGVNFSLAIFLKPLEEEFGWSRSLISGVALVNWLVFGLASFGWGTLSDRAGARRVVTAGAVVLGAAMVLSSRVTAAWHLYLAYGLLGALGAGAFYAPLSATATRWFTARRGLAMGLLNCGMGLGILVVPPLCRALIGAVGWRATFAAIGLLTWAVVLVAVRTVRDRPEDLGLCPYGEAEAAPGAGPPGQGAAAPDMGPRQTLAHPAFWLIAVVHFCCCAAHAGPIFHMPTHAIDLGVPAMAAASMLGLSGGTSLIGRIGSGLLADRFGGKPALTGMLAFQALALAGYLVTATPGPLFALALVFGVAYGGAMPLYALVAREFFGARAIGTAFGGIFFVSCIGMGLGAYSGGAIHDALGSYATLYLASTLIGAAAVVVALGLRPPRLAPAPTAAR
jgi:sugar phosphate permease